MISFTHKGDFSKLTRYLEKSKEVFNNGIFDKYGKAGLEALASATPKDTGLTASSWYYEIEHSKNRITISFKNSNIQDGAPIAILLQYGHGTKNGGWVEGRDYINPAIRPVFEKLAKESWEVVTKL